MEEDGDKVLGKGMHGLHKHEEGRPARGAEHGFDVVVHLGVVALLRAT